MTRKSRAVQLRRLPEPLEQGPPVCNKVGGGPHIGRAPGMAGQWHIKVGDSFARAIEDAPRASRFMIIVMSPDYFQSVWTTHEWHSGLAEELQAGGIRLIPIMYRDDTVPPMLRTRLWVDFRDDSQYQPVLGRLVRDLHELGSGETPTRRRTKALRARRAVRRTIGRGVEKGPTAGSGGFPGIAQHSGD